MANLQINPDAHIGNSSVSLTNLMTKTDGDGYARCGLQNNFAPVSGQYSKIPWKKIEGTSNVSVNNGDITFGNNVGWALIVCSVQNANWAYTAPYFILESSTGSILFRAHPANASTSLFSCIVPVITGVSYYITLYNMDNTSPVAITNAWEYTYLTIKTWGKG